MVRLTFETARKLRGGPSLVYAHSMGNNVFRYFLEWLKLEIAPKHYMEWLDDHIHAYYAVGLPTSLFFSLSLWWILSKIWNRSAPCQDCTEDPHPPLVSILLKLWRVFWRLPTARIGGDCEGVDVRSHIWATYLRGVLSFWLNVTPLFQLKRPESQGLPLSFSIMLFTLLFPIPKHTAHLS